MLNIFQKAKILRSQQESIPLEIIRDREGNFLEEDDGIRYSTYFYHDSDSLIYQKERQLKEMRENHAMLHDIFGADICMEDLEWREAKLELEILKLQRK